MKWDQEHTSSRSNKKKQSFPILVSWSTSWPDRWLTHPSLPHMQAGEARTTTTKNRRQGVHNTVAACCCLLIPWISDYTLSIYPSDHQPIPSSERDPRAIHWISRNPTISISRSILIVQSPSLAADCFLPERKLLILFFPSDLWLSYLDLCLLSFPTRMCVRSSNHTRQINCRSFFSTSLPSAPADDDDECFVCVFPEADYYLFIPISSASAALIPPTHKHTHLFSHRKFILWWQGMRVESPITRLDTIVMIVSSSW